jgi:hypothetical protein
MTGKTLSDWVPITEGLPRPPQVENDPLLGMPSLFKRPVGRIVAIDLNTGEHLWMIPHGDTSSRDQEMFRGNPLMKGVTSTPTSGGGARRRWPPRRRCSSRRARPRTAARTSSASTRRPASASAPWPCRGWAGMA